MLTDAVQAKILLTFIAKEPSWVFTEITWDNLPSPKSKSRHSFLQKKKNRMKLHISSIKIVFSIRFKPQHVCSQTIRVYVL